MTPNNVVWLIQRSDGDYARSSSGELIECYSRHSAETNVKILERTGRGETYTVVERIKLADTAIA